MNKLFKILKLMIFAIFTISSISLAQVGWANLQWPPSATINVGESTTVYAQIWIDGVTNQPGAGAGIQAWIGINSSNTNPATWTNWIPAVYNLDVGNNDEYMASIGASLAPGTYYYASRFIYSADTVYGGYNSGGGGFWDGVNNVSGVLVVDAVIPVELTSFVASVVERDVLLTWSTATETDNLGFEIERKSSIDNQWSKVSFIKSAGTTTEPQQYSFKDSRLVSGKYSYRLKIVDLDGTYSYSDAVEVEIGLPTNYSLSQNYPNPFNPTTRIDYQLPFDAKVQIELYSITGEKIATLVSGDVSAGYHTYELNASRLNLASGIYFYRISAVDVQNGKFIDTKKLVLLK